MNNKKYTKAIENLYKDIIKTCDKHKIGKWISFNPCSDGTYGHYEINIKIAENK